MLFSIVSGDFLTMCVCVCMCVICVLYTKNEPSSACVALTLDIAYARCLTAPCSLALCALAQIFMYFPVLQFYLGVYCVPLPLEPTLYGTVWSRPRGFHCSPFSTVSFEVAGFSAVVTGKCFLAAFCRDRF